MKESANMDRYKLITVDGGVIFSGVDMGGVGTIIAENKECIAIKFPAGSHWASRGSRSYHSPSIYVLRKSADGWLYKLIDWDVKKKSKQP